MKVGGVESTTVDGVRVLHAQADGPLRAVLMFRVGQADETLSIRGVTHLVEHLALSTTERGPHAYNGATAAIFTSFIVAGEADEVVSHLEQVCRGLGQLPLDRLEHERGVLKTEAAQAGGAAAKSLAAWRWGPTGHGLLGFDELGLDGLTTQATAGWARRWFTRDNAVLWLSGPVPPQLRLPLLGPQRDAQRDLPSTQTVVSLPASYTFSPKGVALSYVVPRSDAGPALLYILQRRLQTRLRDQLGVSYGVQAGLEPLCATHSQHLLVADCLPENASRAQQHFTEVVQDLLAKPIAADELDHFQAFADLAETETVSRTLGHLDYAARQTLLGGTISSAKELRAQREALRPDDVHQLALEAGATMLLALPDATTSPLTWAPPSPAWSDRQVTGTTYEPSPQRRDRRLKTLIVGEDGISVDTDEGAVTVLFNGCAGMMRYDDGGRALIGNDGFIVRFHPADWVGAQSVAAFLDSQVPAGLWLVGGAGSAKSAPAPTPTPSPVAAKRRIRLSWRRRGVVIATLFAIGGIARLVDGGSHASLPTPDSSVSDLVGFGSLGLVDGECLGEGTGAPDLQVSCNGPHEAEVIVAAPIVKGADNQDPTTTCSRAAQQILTRIARNSVDILAVPDTGDEQLTCIALAKDGGPLLTPLARTHTG